MRVCLLQFSAEKQLLPTLWELAVRQWRSHGYKMIEAALKKSTEEAALVPKASADALRNAPQITALYDFLNSAGSSQQRPPRVEFSSHCPLEDAPFDSAAAQARQEILQKLLNMPIINVALVAAWLALDQWPTDLMPEYRSLSASFAAVAKGSGAHPINRVPVSNHLKKGGKGLKINILSTDWRNWCPVPAGRSSLSAGDGSGKARPPICGVEVREILKDLVRVKARKCIESAADAFWNWRLAQAELKQAAIKSPAGGQVALQCPSDPVGQELQSDEPQRSIQSSPPHSVPKKRLTRKDGTSRQGSTDSESTPRRPQKRISIGNPLSNKGVANAASRKRSQGKRKGPPTK